MKYILKIVTLVGGVSLGVVTAGILAVFCFSTPSAYADTQDWFAEGATAELIEDSLRSTPRMLNHSRQCKTQEITIVIDNMPGNINSCIYQAKSFRFGWVPRHIDGQDRSSLAISLGTDSKFYMINNLKPQWWNDSYWHASTESDDIVFSDGKVFMIFKDVPTLLDRDFDFEGEL